MFRKEKRFHGVDHHDLLQETIFQILAYIRRCQLCERPLENDLGCLDLVVVDGSKDVHMTARPLSLLPLGVSNASQNPVLT
jgi:hypothetical protein